MRNKIKQILNTILCIYLGHIPGKRDNSPTQMQCIRCGEHGI